MADTAFANDYGDYTGTVVHGYDPMFVAFIDETSARSYSTSGWEYDFGDEIVYGLLSEERATSSVPFSMELPGDKEMLAMLLNDGSNAWLNGTSRNAFDTTSIMNPRVVIGWDGNSKMPTASSSTVFLTYPTTTDYGIPLDNLSTTRGMKHVTSYSFTLSPDGVNRYGNSEGYKSMLASSDDMLGYEEREISPSAYVYRRPVSGAQIRVSQRGAEDCSRGGLCEMNNGDGSTVGHVFKGPGVYTVTLRQTSKSPESTVGQIPAETDFERRGFEYAVATVVVHPSCPCVETHIFGEKPGEDARKTQSYRYHAVLSSTEYTADRPSAYGGMINENPDVFSLYDQSGKEIFHGVSGYAPFVMTTSRTTIRQASVPVSGVRVEVGDWYTDTAEISANPRNAYARGWPVWEPDGGTMGDLEWASGRLAVNQTHTYIMPGIYKPTVFIAYNTDRVPEMFTEELDECDYPAIPMVMVREIAPHHPNVEKLGSTTDNGHTVMTFGFDAIAGSFPICDVVWDFDDGTKPFKLTRNVSAGYAEDFLVGDHTSARYVGGASYEVLSAAGLQYGAIDASAASAVKASTKVYPPGVYAEYDPRRWEVSHEYIRTCAEDRYQYVVSAMAYACNTETMTLATYVTSADELPLPDFRRMEGEVRLIDARTFNDADEMVMTLEGDNGTRTTLYNLKWDGVDNG